MLEAEEVDDDYFTPVTGTSLANIFGSLSHQKKSTDNDTLKYVPPKSQDLQKKSEQAKVSECIYACALIGHEWFNNVYTSRGKLGFAIVKITKTGDHNIVLYDSNKSTLSCSTISSKFELSIKNGTYVSFYDNFQKYWSLYASEEEVKKIVEILNKFNAVVTYSTYTDSGPPEPKNSPDGIKVKAEDSIESDTDSSINRKTKASILNRMANMGHSVFPTHTIPAERTSDSSDTNESNSHSKVVQHKHKMIKSIVKRNIESNQELQSTSEAHQKMPNTEPAVENTQLYTSLNRQQQLLPLGSASIITGHNNEMNIFMSEQRISNSELRINVNRVTDKVDQILEKVNNIEHKSTNVQTDILMKLLTEYENKIKIYENLLKAPNVDVNISPDQAKEVDKLKMVIQDLEESNKDKCQQILILQNEIKQLKLKHVENIASESNKEDELLQKINNLEKKIAVKTQELLNVEQKFDSTYNNKNAHELEVENKLKSIMNDTFQAISVNFEYGETYSGEKVKKVIAAVIKKITMETLNNP